MSRQLKSRSNTFLGVDQKVWIGLEDGGYGDSATSGLVPDDSKAVDFNSCAITFDIPREDSASRSGRSVVARLSGKKTVEAKVESHIIPADADALGNPQLPPMHPLLVSAFGEFDVSNPEVILYKLSRFSEFSARILEETTHYSRLINGVVCNSLTFSLPGDGKATMSMEGFGQDAYIAGETKLAQAITGVEVQAAVTFQSLDFVAASGLGKAGNEIKISYIDKDAVGNDGIVKATKIGNEIVVQIEVGVTDADAIITLLTNATIQTLIEVPSVNVGFAGADVQIVGDEMLVGGLGAFDIVLAAGEGIRIEAGSYIDIIDGVDGDTILLQKALVADVAAPPTTAYNGPNKDIITLADTTVMVPCPVDSYIIGHAPETYLPITSEKALLGLKGSFKIGDSNVATDCDLISAEISINNNYTKKDFSYGMSKSCGYIPDKRREVSCKLDVLLTKETFSFYMQNKQFLAQDVVITLEPQDIPGPSYRETKGRTFKFTLPKVEFNLPNIENPADGYVTLSLEGKALAPSPDRLDEEFKLEII